MKLSTFLFKTLKSFNNGKSYSSKGSTIKTKKPGFIEPDGCSSTCNICWNYSPGKNRNLIGQLNRLDDKLGTKMSNRAQASIAKSLGHTNVSGFQKNGFSKVKAVVKAAIKRERAAGN